MLHQLISRQFAIIIQQSSGLSVSERNNYNYQWVKFIFNL